MKAPVTVDVALLAQSLRISNHEGIQALRAGLKDAEEGLVGLIYEMRREPFYEWCYKMGQVVGFKLREQPGYVKGAELVRPTPKGGWVVARRSPKKKEL